MYENLGMLAFTVLIVGQFAAVIAVHSWRATNRVIDDERSSPARGHPKNVWAAA